MPLTGTLPTMTGWLYVTVLAALTILSLRSLFVLGASAPWTSGGWLATIGYDVFASAEVLSGRHLPAHAPYWFLAALTLAFVVAGVRDEPQAEPWWWPRARGATRAQRRARITR